MKPTSIICKKTEMILIMNSYEFVSIAYHEITDIVYNSPYVIINKIDNEKKIIYSPLSKIGEKLPDYFVACSRAVILNLKQVNCFNKREGIVCLNTGKSHLVSFRKRNIIQKRLLALKIDVQHTNL